MSKTSSNGRYARKLAVILLAAASGAQFRSRRPRALHHAGGRTLLGHALAVVSGFAAPENIFAVLGHQAEQVRLALDVSSVDASGVQTIQLPKQGGLLSALQSARKALAGFDRLLILPCDLPLLRPETLAVLLQVHRRQRAAITILTAPHGSEVAIVQSKALFKHAGKVRDLSALAVHLRNLGGRVATAEPANPAELRAPKFLADLAALDAELRAATAHRLMASGVTVYRPETCVFDAGVQVAPDTIIEPFVQLLGHTTIGTACRIRSYSVIENCALGRNVLVRQSCILAESSIADGARIGPFAHLRPGSEIGPEVHIGNFVETKKARLGKGAKANHLSYLGDAVVGAGTNVGAGVITCNYDGRHKHTTQIGAGVFVGSDSTLVAPVTIEDGAYIGAGSCITQPVPAGALAVARAHQVVKEGWVAARRQRQKQRCD
ncbi:MAG TPA: NTP transferase domain-containing protein [Terracidiphilus sp.]|nr:NTP transferase domain-containing protein [Terracidiphilus sp.]